MQIKLGGKRTVPAALVLLMLMFLVLSGCATAPDVDTALEVEKEEIAVSETKEPAVVLETVFLVEEELSFFSDGVLDERRLNTYSEDGIELLETHVYNSEDVLSERSLAEYRDGNMVTLTTVNADDEVLSLHRYEYLDGRMVEDRLFNGKDELQTALNWEYDNEGRKTRWSIYNGSGALLAYTLYHYEGADPVRIESYSPAGVLQELFVNEYADGRLQKMTQYDGSENVVSYTTSRYESGALVEELVHRKNGAVRRKTLFENDEVGNPLKIIYLDASNNVLEMLERSYISRTISRTMEQE
jgi:hypothetical protein